MKKTRCQPTGWKTMGEVVEYPWTFHSSSPPKPHRNVSLGGSGAAAGPGRSTMASMLRSKTGKSSPVVRMKWWLPWSRILALDMVLFISGMSAAGPAQLI